MAAKFKSKKFTASDGKIMIVLETCEEGGYYVYSPLDPELHTQGDSLEEAFEMAHDALKLLNECRREMMPRKPKRQAA
jgi:antitoxin HicB